MFYNDKHTKYVIIYIVVKNYTNVTDAEGQQ